MKQYLESVEDNNEAEAEDEDEDAGEDGVARYRKK